MLFVTVSTDRKQLDELTVLLLRAFHGSVIYQHTDPVRALRDVQTHQADAVIVGKHADGMDGLSVLQLLRRSGPPQTAVLVLSENEAHSAAALEQGADGTVCCPLTEYKLRDALEALL